MRKEIHKILRLLGFKPIILVIKPSKQHNKALSKEGVNPANQTKSNTAFRENNLEKLRPKNLENVDASPAKKERCIPERANMCARPEFLKFSAKLLSVYSPEPETKAKNKPPESPQA